MQYAKHYFSLLVLALCLSLAGCAGSVTAPTTPTETVAYTGSTLQAISDTAASQYEYMSDAQVKQVHRMIVQARTVRDQAVSALRVGDTDLAQNKMDTLVNMLSIIQSKLKEYENGE